MAKPAIFGLVASRKQADSAILALETAGFIRTDISVLTSATEHDPDSEPGFAKTRDVGVTNSTKAPEGATAGAAAGGALGAATGWLAGIGALAIPGVGPLMAVGPIFTALSMAAVGMAAGGVSGGLIGYGVPEYEAKLYAGKLENGHILVGVHAVSAEEAEAAERALESVGAESIKVTKEVGS